MWSERRFLSATIVQVSFHTGASVVTQPAFSWAEEEPPAWRLSRDPPSIGDLQSSPVNGSFMGTDVSSLLLRDLRDRQEMDQQPC